MANRRWGRGRGKFGVAPKAERTYGGIVFDSKKEMTRYVVLKGLEQQGVIQDLELQPKFDLVVNGEKVCRYVADFRYTENGVRVVEDVKGMRTDVYKLKKKLYEAIHGTPLRET